MTAVASALVFVWMYFWLVSKMIFEVFVHVVDVSSSYTIVMKNYDFGHDMALYEKLCKSIDTALLAVSMLM